MGVFAVMPIGVGQQVGWTYWALYGDASSSGNPWVNRTLQVSYYATNVGPGTVNYKTYFVVGNLDMVTYVLSELRMHPDIVW